MRRPPLRVGLTGGIACGKSEVSAELRRLGAQVVDADEIARRVVEPGRPAHAEIVARFGGRVLDRSGRIDRKALAALVFSDPRARADLEAITHPRIWQEAEAELARLEREGARLVFYDAPLLVEAGLWGRFSLLVVVAADEGAQIERIRARDGLSVEEARARLAAQMPVEQKARLADHVIRNDGTLEELRAKVRGLYEELVGSGAGEG